MSKRHNRPDVNGIDSGKHIQPGLRPPATAPDAPVFDVPHRKPVSDKHFGQRPPQLQPIPLMPETTVNDNNSTLGSARRKPKLPELAGMVPINNPLHPKNLRETPQPEATTRMG